MKTESSTDCLVKTLGVNSSNGLPITNERNVPCEGENRMTFTTVPTVNMQSEKDCSCDCENKKDENLESLCSKYSSGESLCKKLSNEKSICSQINSSGWGSSGRNYFPWVLLGAATLILLNSKKDSEEN